MNIFIGKQLTHDCVDELKSKVSEARAEGYDFVVAPINRCEDKFDPVADISLNNKTWTDRIVINLAQARIFDSISKSLSMSGAKIFRRLLRYALYLPSAAIIIDCPKNQVECLHLAQIINQTLKETRETRSQEPLVVLRISICLASGDPWKLWYTLLTHLATDRRICVGLALNGDDLPDLEIRQRWFGEPVKFIFLDENVFKANKEARPVLAHQYRDFVHDLVRSQSFCLSLVVTAIGKTSGVNEIRWQDYREYLQSLRNSFEKENCDIHFDKGDMLQVPLQPLSRDLESMTYNVFEQDPIKYQEYEESIYEALMDLKAKNYNLKTERQLDIDDAPRLEDGIKIQTKHLSKKLFNPGLHKQFKPVILIVGAGRGPLVCRTLEALKRCGIFATIYIVEKNPNSIVTLEYLINNRMVYEYPINQKDRNASSNTVEIVNADMRGWCPENKQKADIVISELLGSFGDNELSPECLEGLWRATKHETISIPCSYTSYICPIMYGTVHRHLLDYQLENLFVSKLTNHYRIDQAHELFTFYHNEKNMTVEPSNLDHSRYKCLRFTAVVDVVCHGFGGYFETTLYNGHKLSIVPGRETKGLISWFPAYIPIVEPIYLEAGQQIEVNFWRVVTGSRVWYEWALTEPKKSKIYSLDSTRASSRAMSKNYEV